MLLVCERNSDIGLGGGLVDSEMPRQWEAEKSKRGGRPILALNTNSGAHTYNGDNHK